jgi:hypothetical protein
MEDIFTTTNRYRLFSITTVDLISHRKKRMNTETIKSTKPARNVKEKSSEDAVSHAVESPQNAPETGLIATHYPASGSLASMLFYVKAQCKINDKTFDGNAWGVNFPGGGALFGEVYLSDNTTLNDLYSKTSNFLYTATPLYTAFYFYDSDNNLLGHFQAGSVSTVFGSGGGSGSWS